MATNQQRREAAKRKLDRQLEHRAQQAKRNRTIGIAVTIGAVVVIAGVIVFLATRGTDGEGSAAPADQPTPTTEPSRSPATGCDYTKSEGEPAAKPVTMPANPIPTPNEGTVNLTLQTSSGGIGITMDRAQAPCTVQSIAHLAKSKFFDDTPCHRMTSSAGLKVLQCGDPSGAGNGGPGYTIPDEAPKNLKPSADGQAAIYPRGVVAMANTGQPHSGGSQFFLVYGDSTLPPDYTVFGTIDRAGLAVLDKIAKAGITAGDRGPEDGAPKAKPVIEKATVKS